jgi:hypothetical protein
MPHTVQQRREWASRYRKKNREKIRAYALKWYHEHLDKQRAWSKRKFHMNPEKHRTDVRRDYLDRTYGKGAAEYYDSQLALQNGRCAICGKPAINRKFGKLHLDHDTSCCPYQFSPAGKRKMLRSCGKCRRGLLCNNCNSVLPGIENLRLLESAIAYLRTWQQNNKREAI